MGEISSERLVTSERPPYINPALHFQSGVSSRNNPTYTLPFTVCIHVQGCIVMMLHFENVWLGRIWAVKYWVPAAHLRFPTRPLYNGSMLMHNSLTEVIHDYF